MRTRRTTVATLLALLALALPAFPAARSRGLGRLTGTVISEQGEPIAGATVSVPVGDETLRGRSDSAGKFAVLGLGKGEYLATFAKDGYQTTKVLLVVEHETLYADPVRIAMKKVA